MRDSGLWRREGPSFITPVASEIVRFINKKKGHVMSQANQAVQVSTLPDMKKRVVPTEAYRTGRTWLHLPALGYMIVLTQIPFLLAVWFSLHAWNLLVPSEGFPFVGLAN